jgi:hypothetical protein
LLQNQCKPSQLGKLISSPGKRYTKARIIVSNYGNRIFAPQPDNFTYKVFPFKGIR